MKNAMLPVIFSVSLFAATPTRPLALLPENVFLVRGRVVGGSESPRYTVNQVRITHVYHGPESLIGRTFSAISADELPEGSNPYITVPELRVGETLISIVREWNGELSASQKYAFTPWPVRERGNPDWMPSYDTIKAFADEVERVSRLLGPEEAGSALKRLALDENPYISCWAIARLRVACQDAAGALRFLEALVSDEDVPIQGQVALDSALLGKADLIDTFVDRPNRAWQASQSRLTLFRRWFAGTPARRDAELVVRRLDFITQHHEAEGFPQDDLLTLVTLLAKNDKFPLSERQHTAIIMGWAAERYEVGDEKVFETAVALVSSDLPEQVRMRIAGVVAAKIALDDVRRNVLRKLRDAEKNESVAKMLEHAIARPNGEPERPFVRQRPSQTTQPSALPDPN